MISMISMITLMNVPKYIKLYNNDILEYLTSFYGMRKNRAIICKEMPYQKINSFLIVYFIVYLNMSLFLLFLLFL